jgi:hypothetical protein
MLMKQVCKPAFLLFANWCWIIQKPENENSTLSALHTGVSYGSRAGI